MFCIASFIVFFVLGLFSVTFESLAKKAWYCVFRKITFRPCDVQFGEEMKGKILGVLIKYSPRAARFFNRWGDLLATVFVILSIWSLFAVAITGLNLYVYDTCNPKNAESCSLGGEACGIGQQSLSFIDAVKMGKIGDWAAEPFTGLFTTFSRIPDRMKYWNATDYVKESNTYLNTYDENKPTALEIIDPGCQYCAKLLGNIKEAKFENAYNLTYIVYPIPSKDYEDGYKFKNSYLIAQYLEAIKMVNNHINDGVTTDWKIVEKILLGSDTDGTAWQQKFNMLLAYEDAEKTIQGFLKGDGYNETEILALQNAAHSEAVKHRLEENAKVVENQIRTVKIPTIIFGGRRHDRVVTVKELK